MNVSIYSRFCDNCRVVRTKGVSRIVHLGKEAQCARRAS